MPSGTDPRSALSNSDGGSGKHQRKMIGSWKLGRTIGKGSSGTRLQHKRFSLLTHSGRVKLARHAISGKLAAVKIIPKRNTGQSSASKTSNPEDEARIARSIEREIVIMKLMDHPHVLKLYDVWETSNQL